PYRGSHVGTMLNEYLALDTGQVVLGKLSDPIKKLGAVAIVEKFRCDGTGRLGQTSKQFCGCILGLNGLAMHKQSLFVLKCWRQSKVCRSVDQVAHGTISICSVCQLVGLQWFTGSGPV